MFASGKDDTSCTLLNASITQINVSLGGASYGILVVFDFVSSLNFSYVVLCWYALQAAVPVRLIISYCDQTGDRVTYSCITFDDPWLFVVLSVTFSMATDVFIIWAQNRSRSTLITYHRSTSVAAHLRSPNRLSPDGVCQLTLTSHTWTLVTMTSSSFGARKNSAGVFRLLDYTC